MEEKNEWLQHMKKDFARRKKEAYPSDGPDDKRSVRRFSEEHQEIKMKKSIPDSFDTIKKDNLVLGEEDRHLLDSIVDGDSNQPNKQIKLNVLSTKSAKMVWVCASCGSYCDNPNEHSHHSKRFKSSIMGPFQGTISNETNDDKNDTCPSKVAEIKTKKTAVPPSIEKDENNVLDNLLDFMMAQTYSDSDVDVDDELGPIKLAYNSCSSSPFS